MSVGTEQMVVKDGLESDAKSLLAQVLKVPEDVVRPAKQGGRTIWEIRLEQAVAESA